ncbi:MAG TPA: hypothetical protein VIG99_24470 [Myxococcaceae bacterium]
MRYVKEGQDRNGRDASLGLTRLDDKRVEVTLEVNGKKVTYVLDLTRPDAQQAYDDLTKFRTTRADLLAAKPAKSGVTKAPEAPAQPAQSAQTKAAQTAQTTTDPAKPKTTVQVKGNVKPKLEKSTDANGAVTKTKGAEVSGSATVQSGKTKVDVKGNGKVERSTTTTKDGKTTKTDTIAGGGNVTVTAPVGKGTVTASAGAKVEKSDSRTTDAKGAVVSRTQQKATTLDQSVRVTGKDPKNTAGVAVKETRGEKVETDAAGKKTVTTNRSNDVSADASVTAKVGKEGKLDASASVTARDASTQVVAPDGKTSRTDEKSVVAKTSVTVADTTGPNQESVKVTAGTNRSTKVETAPDGKKTVNDNRSSDEAVSASVTRTSGETVVTASGNASRSDSRVAVTTPDGKTASTTQEKTTADGSLTVADKTGPQQGSVTVKGNVSRDSKVETTKDGAVTRTDNAQQGGSVAVTTSSTKGDRTVSTSTQVDVSSSSTATTGPDGKKTWSDANSVGVTETDTLKKGTTTATAKVQVKSTESESGDEKGVKQEKGTLSAQVDLTAAFKGNRKVGFSGANSRDYTLTLPAGVPQAPALPLNSAAAQALPEGASFTLNGKGTLGVNGEADGFKGGISEERTLQIKVDRQAGTKVTATVDLGRKDTNTESFDRTFGDAKKLNAKLAASNTGTASQGRTEQFSFDLSNPAHQAAYDAALRGDLRQAQQLGLGKVLKSTDAGGNEQQLKAGIAFNKIGASVELDRKDIDPSDDRIQKDPARKAITDAAQKDGKDVRWIERGGAWELGGGYDYGVSPGVAGFGFGFEAKKGMEWRSLGPKVDGEGGAPGVAMNADEAEKMPAGSEFSVRGTTKVSGRASVLGGWQAGGGGVTVSAGVGFDVSKGKTMDLNVRVKKLPDGKVEVRMDQLKTDQASAQFSAKIGASVNGAELAAAGGSVLGALAKKPDVAEKLAGLTKSLSVEFKAGKSHTEEEGKGLVFTLDLSKPEARAAYDKLVRGNPEQALDNADQADRGVHLNSQSELTSKQTDRNMSLKVGNTALFESSDSRKDLTAEVTTEQKTERLDESVAARTRASIFGRRRQLNFDAVSLRTDRAPNGEKFMRLTYEESDRYTSRGELADRRALAKSLGAVPTKPEVVKEEHGGGVMRWISGSHNDHGKVSTSIDAYITSAGIQKIRSAGREQQISAFGEALKDMRGRAPAWNDPATSGRSRELLDGYRTAPERGRDQFRKQYEREFGKDAFKADVKDYARASEFADALAKSSDDVNPAAWNRTFTDLAQKMGFNFFESLSAMNKLAGDSEVVIGKYAMKGRSVDIEMTSEGAVNKPQITGGPTSAEAARNSARK